MVGRGFRSPLRDALLVDDTLPENYGKAFGLERAGDSAGAVLGPTIALILIAVAFPLRGIFLVSLIPGIAAAAVISFAVRERPRPRRPHTPGGLARLRALPGPFLRYLTAVGLFGIGDFSNTLLILWAAGSSAAQESTAGLTIPVLLNIGYNAVSSASAYLAGALGDRVGRRTILAAGYASGTVGAVLIASGAHTLPIMVAVFGLWGLCMGAEESVEKAVAADFVPEHARAFGFGALATVNGIGDFIASVVIGGLWAAFGVRVGFGVSALLCGAGVIALLVLLPRHYRPLGDGPPGVELLQAEADDLG